MHERRLFPASIVDEITYCVDRAYTNLSLIYSWILTLEGEVSTEASQKALDEALNYYPKCKCILVNNYPSYKRWFRHCWECTNLTGKDILEEIEYPGSAFNSEEAVNYYTNNHAHFSIDPSSQVPLKVLLARQPKRAFLFFIFHHAVADGLGSFFFIQKFIQCYEEIFYQRAKETHDETKFNVISSPEIRFRWSHFSPRLLRPYLRHFSLFLKEPSLSLFPHETVGISGEFIATVRQIPPRRLEAIRSTSKKYQATINDYLLATMFQTIKKWSQKWTAQSDRIYITVPMNLRSPEDRTLSNILSGATISFKPELIGDKEEMLHLIREEMTMVMNNNIPRTLINFSSFLKPIPIPLRILILKHSIPGFSPTIVLSNMGVLSPNPSHKDEEGFHYMGPARICNIHGIAAVGGWPMLLIFTYNNRVIFNMSSLSSYFPPETAGRFIDSFLGEIIG
jgi:NRPS condensation-like uncharacterized protein